MGTLLRGVVQIGKKEEGSKDEDLTHQLCGHQHCPNDGCQHCTQVKLKWLQCDGKASSQWTRRIQYAGRTFGGMTGFVQGTH